MTSEFEKYYKNQHLFSKKDKVLLAVSGGKDSVVMVFLFKVLKLNFGIAHCNFKLRGIDSDKDEKFVFDLAKKLNVPFYTTSFDTKTYAKTNKLSIQMAAREMRYLWFAEIKEKYNFQYIATAHHQNDVAETVLLNITKGTGLAGLHGIKNKADSIIRPILFLNRKDIDDLIKKNNLEFREDSSNSNTKYARNRIRHKVVSELEKINPSVVSTICNSANYFAEIETLVNEKINEIKSDCTKESKDGTVEINIKKLTNYPSKKTILFYIINKFGFNSDDVESIVNSLGKQSGKNFLSKTHILIKDRNSLIIQPKISKKSDEIVIQSMSDFKNLPIQIEAQLIKKNQLKLNSNPKKYAFFDSNKLCFPLKLRKWRVGDKFIPFGMKGYKKISDFFIDEKVSVADKQKIWLLVSKNKIVWVVGHRIDDSLRITNQTTNILQLKIR
ncbi:MAG: tRNA lysidine(34) synthetase TilS [Flavobacteriales bacterium]|nr:tRNA lysidine(34) synthetase TilS [Flavobacteriales bacterium]